MVLDLDISTRYTFVFPLNTYFLLFSPSDLFGFMFGSTENLVMVRYGVLLNKNLFVVIYNPYKHTMFGDQWLPFLTE